MKKLTELVKDYLLFLIFIIAAFVMGILTVYKITSINTFISFLMMVFSPIIDLKLKHSKRINSLFNSATNMPFEQVVTLMQQYKPIEFQYIPNESINYLYAYFNMKFLGMNPHAREIVYATYLQKIPITISGEKDEDEKENDNNFRASLLTRTFKEKMHEMGNEVPYYWIVLPATCTNLYRCIKRASFVPRKRIRKGLYKLRLVPLTKYC